MRTDLGHLDEHLVRRGDDGGAWAITRNGVVLRVIASWGGGWDHVSISLHNRCPGWDEMEWVKRLFFKPSEVAMQLHPAESDYVNLHPHCLHIWRPQGAAIPLPKLEFV